MDTLFRKIKKEIIEDAESREFTKKGWEPIFSGTKKSKIIIIGQAPGIRAQESKIPWDDLSGDRLRDWLDVSKEEFYDESLFALIPMDFYYPGKGKSGDVPPRKGFAEKWHKQLLEQMPKDSLIILIGQYAQNFYLKNKRKTLTETVKNFVEYFDNGHIPLPHPSPRNNIWLAKNEWFEKEVLPSLQEEVSKRIK